MPTKPEILNSSLVTHSRLFWVEEMQLRFSNGEERTFERLRTGGHGAVIIVPMLDENTVLLIREYCAGVHNYQLTLPKGACNTDEDVLLTANRELMEETGYGARNLHLLKDITLSPGYMQHSMSVVLAQDLYPQRLTGDEPEPIEVVPYPIADITALLARDDFTEGRAIAALFMAIHHMNQPGS